LFLAFILGTFGCVEYERPAPAGGIGIAFELSLKLGAFRPGAPQTVPQDHFPFSENMRLELDFEPNAPVGVLDAAENDPHVPDASAFVKDGIAAAQRGERERARALLTRAADADPQCEEAWMWLASISEYPEELLAFLNKVLEINPANDRAVEWRAATRSVLAKTLVQRGVAAYDQGAAGLADSCFDQALGHDDKYFAAWLWKARVAASDDEKVACLERVLELDPDNEEAKTAIAPFREPTPQAMFEEAKWTAIAGKRIEALQLLDLALEKELDNAEAWILRSHLSMDLDEKLLALERALEIEPENNAARGSYDFLKATLSAAHAPEAETPKSAEVVDVAGPTTELVSEDEIEPVFETPEEDLPASHAEPAISPFAAYAVESVVEAREQYVHEPLTEQAIEPFEEYAIESVAENGNGHSEPPVDAFDVPVADAASEMLSTENGHADAYVDDVEETQSVEPPAEDTPSESLTVESVHADGYIEPADEYQPVDEQMPHAEATPDMHVEKPFEATMPADERVLSMCDFCHAPVDSQAFDCDNCHAVLTLSDMESLLANLRADHAVVQQAVTKMEAEWNLREFNVEELQVLGIGHINLRNFDQGFKYLEEASRLDPNNVILAGQVNTLAIRLDEMRRQDEVHEAMPRGKSILVVDDSPTIRKLISAKLEKCGHNVTCASDGVEGLEKLAADGGVPDLVLLDIAMPRMDGYEVCKNIRSNPASAHVPVVMISGRDGFFDKVRGKMAGCTGYVTKPFGPETLMKALDLYLIPENAE
jgi:twitching motility two-component system response regulator PilG